MLNVGYRVTNGNGTPKNVWKPGKHKNGVNQGTSLCLFGDLVVDVNEWRWGGGLFFGREEVGGGGAFTLGLKATSHTRLRARDQYISSTPIGVESVQVPFTLWLRDQTEYVCECKMDVKSTWMDSYMASNGSCFMVTWTIFKNHLLEVGLTQNRETMALWMLTTVGLFYFIISEELHG